MSETTDSPTEQLDRLERSLFQLSDVIRKHQTVVQKRFKVSGTEIDILRLLKDEGEKKMKDIGDSVHVKLSNLTNIVDRLEEQKLVKRVNSKSDRRSIFVHISTRGKKLLDDYGMFLRELSTRMQKAIEEDHFMVLIDGLEKITQVTLPED
jgi:MarR family 2-MHQ and catechol resistance regulon transcriptional repressor